MKKTVFLAAALLIGAGSYAQDEEKVYLPETDDWAIGVDATPFLSYFGNFIGGNDGNTAPTWNFLTTNQTITGKYFVSESMAYRGSVRLGFGSNSGSMMVGDRSDTAVYDYPEVPAELENSFKASSTNIGLSGGIEWRKGKGRLQGFYGGELGFMISSSKQSFTYGNELTQVTNPTNVNVDPADGMDVNGDGSADNFTSDPTASGNTARILESKSGMMFGLGLRGFIGAEYFVLPKLSIGGEFGWGLMFTANGTSSTTMESEGFNGSGDELTETFTVEQDNGSSFGIDTDSNNTVFGPAGTIRLTFHF